MRRRGVVAGSVALAAAGRTRAQPATRTIGYLSARSAEFEVELLSWLRQGLAETGFVEGRNLAIEPRFANGDYARLPELAAELVRRQVAVIATTGGVPAARAARDATSTIPVVFTMATDPLEDRLVASYARPGGNVTGVVLFSTTLGPKKLEILRELIPGTQLIGFLSNPRNEIAKGQLKDIDEAAGTLGQRISIVRASTPPELDSAFAELAALGAGALLISADPFYQLEIERLVALAARHRLPTMYEWPAFVRAGGLISYASDRRESFVAWGVQIGRILNGARPGDLPVVSATKFDLSINLRTARALGMAIPAPLLARADEVIE